MKFSKLFSLLIIYYLLFCINSNAVVLVNKGTHCVLVKDQGSFLQLNPPSGKYILSAYLAPNHNLIIMNVRDKCLFCHDSETDRINEESLPLNERLKHKGYETILLNGKGHHLRTLWKSDIYYEAGWSSYSNIILVYSQLPNGKSYSNKKLLESIDQYHRFSWEFPGTLYSINIDDNLTRKLSDPKSFVMNDFIQSYPKFIVIGIMDSNQISQSPYFNPFPGVDWEQRFLSSFNIIDYNGKILSVIDMKATTEKWDDKLYNPLMIRQCYLDKLTYFHLSFNQNNSKYILQEWDFKSSKPIDIFSFSRATNDIAIEYTGFPAQISPNGKYLYFNSGEILLDLDKKECISIPIPSNAVFVEFNGFSPNSDKVYYSIKWNNKKNIYRFDLHKRKSVFIWNDHYSLLINKIYFSLNSLFHF